MKIDGAATLPSSNFSLLNSRRAFSLIEMMIAIVILGLGMVMTATMFPVAWTRARTLTEYTMQRSIAANVEAALASKLRASGSSVRKPNVNAAPVSLLTAGSLAGDFFYDPTITGVVATANGIQIPAIVAFSDTLVHSLNMANLQAFDPASQSDPARPLVDEDPWMIERMFDIESTTLHPVFGGGFEVFAGEDGWAREFRRNSFYTAQIPIEQRVHPPMDPYPPVGASEASVDKWREKLSTRRFAWSVLHRQTFRVGPSPDKALTLQDVAAAQSATGTTRVVDLYVVTLRRAQLTSRYALQDPSFAPNSPISSDPTKRDRSVAAAPRALLAKEDVFVPAPWRVQIELPKALNLRNPAGSTGGPSGIPTEVQAPPGTVGNLVVSSMFPQGTQFVDEINGQVYRVVKRRTNAAGDLAFLTLDRELLWEDFDDSDDLELKRFNPPQLDDDEFIRTVWVFPPADERPASDPGTVPLFDDTSPVVGIDVRTISLSPPG